ncbi:MAG TPA: phosphopentomutase [Planktothrix sp.]
MQNKAKRAIVLVIDGCGIGAAPDAEAFGDPTNTNTIGNVAREMGGLKLPIMTKLGLGNITQLAGIPRVDSAMGVFGKLQEASNGKDTQTGHWEMMGIVSEQAFPLYPNGFPDDVIQRFIDETGCKGILCNKPASGTQILEELAEEHRRTGFPIVYTSGDSVFQIATNTEVTPLPTLYRWCEIARGILQGEHRVGRVIARPFKGGPGNYVRLGGDRHDYSVPPPAKTLMDQLVDKGIGVFGVGKIEDIFVGNGLTHAKHTGINKEGLELTLQAVAGSTDYRQMKIGGTEAEKVQFIFTNLVDTDSLFGHRRNVSGYAGALTEIDEWLGKIMASMTAEDMLIISSDHGNDPTAPGTDHTREFVPLLAYSPAWRAGADAFNAGTRQGFTDIAASIAGWLGTEWRGPGVSFVPETVKATA